MFICFKMLHNILSFTILLILSLASYPSTNGLTVPLIPPMSPQSPFYTQILEANNISTTTRNITLDRNHYMTWFLSKVPVSLNEKSEVYFKTDGSFHAMNMYMGIPKQLVYGIFDTGSSLTWFQCQEGASEPKYPCFNQTKSATYGAIRCEDEQECNTNYAFIKGCDELGSFCEFKTAYGDGSIVYGVMATENTAFNWPRGEVLVQFRFGCSSRPSGNSIDLMGIIGASNSDYALPKQLYRDDPKFSYCMSGDSTKTGFVAFGPDAILKGQTINMLRNSYTEYYYIDVLGIKVNGERIAVPPSAFEMSASGSTGFIIDSGVSLTTLTSDAFEALKDKMEQLFGPPTKYMIFEICYNSGKFGWRPWKTRPTIGIDFANYLFEFAENTVWVKMPGSNDLECLQIVRTNLMISMLGSQQLQNVNVGYDPNNKLLYLQKTTCPTLDD